MVFLEGFWLFVRRIFNSFKAALYARLELALGVPDGSGASADYPYNRNCLFEHTL